MSSNYRVIIKLLFSIFYFPNFQYFRKLSLCLLARIFLFFLFIGIVYHLLQFYKLHERRWYLGIDWKEKIQTHWFCQMLCIVWVNSILHECADLIATILHFISSNEQTWIVSSFAQYMRRGQSRNRSWKRKLTRMICACYSCSDKFTSLPKVTVSYAEIINDEFRKW